MIHGASDLTRPDPTKMADPVSGRTVPISPWVLTPKFHYADFPATSATSPRQIRDVPVDLSATSPTSLFPRRKRAGRRLVAGIFQTISTCRDGLNPRTFLVTRVTGKFQEVGVMEFRLYQYLSLPVRPSRAIRVHFHATTCSILEAFITKNYSLCTNVILLKSTRVEFRRAVGAIQS